MTATPPHLVQSHIDGETPYLSYISRLGVAEGMRTPRLNHSRTACSAHGVTRCPRCAARAMVSAAGSGANKAACLGTAHP